MKIGDSIYCIKSNSDHPNYIINNGSFYKISKIFASKKISIILESGDEWMFTLQDENYYYSFDEYFITKNKVRKIKLDKINERRR